MAARPPFRIFSLPLRVNSAKSSKLPTFYTYRVIAPPPIPKTRPRTIFTRWMPEEGLGNWTTDKVTHTWANFGAAEKGTLKQRAYQLGERLMEQMDFEESNLRTFHVASSKRQNNSQVPLYYPPAVLSGPQSLVHLQEMVRERVFLHLGGALKYILISILTVPLKLIPIIPNFPFYFCAWRTWSHFQAAKGATSIQALLKENRIVPVPLKTLDAMYSDALDGAVLTHEALERAMHVLNLAPEERKVLLRARDQVLSRETTT
ncbi:mitochondrial K+-H+ exchange-related-domain-containing protein [Mycena galericulata]|nr:mitochondrial K+-H+ exchange-related-domain-containing protein [Mycena galericulata]